MNNIVVIGAGNIGRRHMQSLKELKHMAKIYVVDINNSSLELARNLWDKTEGMSHSIEYCKTVDDVPLEIKLAIVATTSGNRATITRDLLIHKRIENLILEKVLFQKPEDYSAIGELIEKSNCKAWVNCPRRIFDFYGEIRKSVLGQKIEVFVRGNNWGLMCNTIHFVDLVAFLSGEQPQEIDVSGLDERLFDSKRDGYYEMNGCLEFKYSGGSTLSLACFEKTESGVAIEIVSGNQKWIIFEEEGRLCSFNNSQGLKINEIKIQVPFQSKLTALYAESLFEGRDLRLTPYEESARLHLALIVPVIKFLKDKMLINEERYPFT
ncbi:MAG: Gfo/Idh/MocA family oxidoreductase [Clostridia bacterium]|nr:Gfo/Idh/MocA family oxidoreductase [Clostridia bacterium]